VGVKPRIDRLGGQRPAGPGSRRRPGWLEEQARRQPWRREPGV